jgi:hypothetical protein
MALTDSLQALLLMFVFRLLPWMTGSISLTTMTTRLIRHVGSHLACFYGGNWILGDLRMITTSG